MQNSPQATSTKPNPQPTQPFSITVVAPDKSAAEPRPNVRTASARVDIQAQIRTFTVTIGGLQVLAMIFGLLYTARTANAAKTSAETARDTPHITATRLYHHG